MRREEALVEAGASLFARGLAHGRTGNLSVRDGDALVVTPTGSSLGSLAADELARLGLDGAPRGSGPTPSKEWFLHAAMYRARPDAGAVVHLHSTYSVAAACLADVDPEDVLPPLTPYYAMRVKRLPLLPYYRPGDPALGPVAELAAARTATLLLANHGPVVAARDLSEALDVIEELEATARLALLLHDRPVRTLTPEQVAELRASPRSHRQHRPPPV